MRRSIESKVATIFAATIFVSATLLFLVQPLVARLLLPRLGGSSMVWNTCQVFFQACLLGGYAYAHVLSNHVKPRGQTLVHIAVIAAGFLFLPLAFSGQQPPADPSPLWVLGELAAHVGIPFFVLAASTPLFHRWFTHADAGDSDGFELYAASNLGSLVALLTYPIVIEPTSGLDAQTIGWSVGFVLLAVLVGACAWLVANSQAAAADHAEALPEAAEPAGWRLCAKWVIWAFIPSSLFLSVTTHLTTDLVSMPFLWIPPLALYLLTFIVVFSNRTWIRRETMMAMLPAWLLASFFVLLLDLEDHVVFAIPMHLALVFVVGMVFHGQLHETRKGGGETTRFYLCMSFGGLLGGVFVALLAPLLFDDIREYETTLILATLLLPTLENLDRDRLIVGGVFTVAAAGLVGAHLFASPKFAATPPSADILLVLFIAALLGLALRRTRSFAWTASALMLLGVGLDIAAGDGAIFKERSYFGRVIVQAKVENGLPKHIMVHGDTVHGEQVLDDKLGRVPLSYYGPESGIARTIEQLNRRRAADDVMIVGLGAGAMAAFAREGQSWTFLEIDPLIARVAQNPDYFTFLENCGKACDVVVGDGRMVLDEMDDRAFDLLVLDAYSSDSIPVHLITREAAELYRDRLKLNGVLAFQISNRYVSLREPLANIAAAIGLDAFFVRYIPSAEHEKLGVKPSDWVFMTAPDTPMRDWFAAQHDFVPLSPTDAPVWTDDYANVLGAILKTL
ncbi:MAG: spermidine synthase [Myxococcota bacterium]